MVAPFLSRASVPLARQTKVCPCGWYRGMRIGTEAGRDHGRRGDRIETFPRHKYGRVLVSFFQFG